ncbi:YrbA protein [hydrothermal vent metagenome]|uniref:YrbA protein n=1 Tax=hydrothermal vent metagenome TaxID=652676 RepID=A0A3B1AVJ9_9ZZZZ
MEPNQVEELIKAGLPDCEVTVTGDGSHFNATIIGDVFEGMMPVKKQQLVYKTVNEYITSGELHAFTMKTYTPAEWEKAKMLQGGSL